jgi:hypothetical protein
MENQKGHSRFTKDFSPDSFRFLYAPAFNQKDFGFYSNSGVVRFLLYNFSLKTIKAFKLL